MKNKLEKILGIIGYSLIVGLGFTILWFGFKVLGEIWKVIFK